MTLSQLIKLLQDIKECHPEAENAEVWAYNKSKKIHIGFVGYDKRHKPMRIKLEQ